MPEWRSGSATALHAVGRGVRIPLRAYPSGSITHFIMTRRNISDREHLEALVFAIENLANDSEVKYSVYSGAAFQRALRAAERAKADLFPAK